MLESLFEGFEQRDAELDMIKRFHGIQFMHYRTTNLIHSNRTAWLVKDVIPFANMVFGDQFNPHYALLLGKVHDDHEIHLGDITLDVKMKMTPDERKWLREEEMYSVKVIASRAPERVNGFWYQDLLMDAVYKKSLESHVVSFCDKVDGYCESLHEVLGGNKEFVKPLSKYTDILKERQKNYPTLENLFTTDHPFFTDPPAVPAVGKLHDSRSIIYPTHFPHYDRWKELTLKQEGWKPLLVVKEFSGGYTQVGIPGDRSSVHTS